MIIDAHNHLGGPDVGDGRSQTAAQLIASMDAAGVDKAVIFPFNTPGEDGSFRIANDFIAAAVSDYPDRLVGCGRVDPNKGELAVLEAERCFIEYKMSGLKLHPKAQEFPISHPVVSDLMRVVADYQAIAVFDSGTRIAPWPALSSLAARFPHISIIAAHMHGDGYLDAAQLAPNLYLGTTDIKSGSRIMEAVSFLGARQIISGSDSPYIAQQVERDKIDSMEMPDADKMLIAGENMRRLLYL